MLTRRDYLRSLAAAATTTLALPEPRAWASAAEKLIHPAPKADSVIVLWMAGGMAAPDTFDPKKHKPFEPGLAVADVISTFPSIPRRSTACGSATASRRSRACSTARR